MIWRVLLAAFLTLLAIGVSRADMNLTIVGDTHQSGGGGGFVGVVDQDPNAVHFWGLVAADAAKATANVTAVDLCDNSSCVLGINECIGVKVLSTGQLDISSGLYCDSVAGSPTETVSTWCTNSGNCVVASTDAVARITTLYDQIGSANATEAYATAPGFILSGVSSKPTGMCVSGRSTTMAATITSISAPWSVGGTYERFGNTGTFNYLISSANFFLGNPNSINNVEAQLFGATGNIIAAATDGSGATDFAHFHRALMTQPSPSGSVPFYVDGAAATPGTSTFTATTNTAIATCGTTSHFESAFFTNAWLDNTEPNSTVGDAVTNLTTVPLP